MRLPAASCQPSSASLALQRQCHQYHSSVSTNTKPSYCYLSSPYLVLQILSTISTGATSLRTFCCCPHSLTCTIPATERRIFLKCYSLCRMFGRQSHFQHVSRIGHILIICGVINNVFFSSQELTWLDFVKFCLVHTTVFLGRPGCPGLLCDYHS